MKPGKMASHYVVDTSFSCMSDYGRIVEEIKFAGS